MSFDPFLQVLMGRGLSSDLAQRISVRFPDWEALNGASITALGEYFAPKELDAIKKARKRRGIPRETVNRLIDECAFQCCLCWNFDSDRGVVIHHIRSHAKAPDDSFENLIILCADHHDRVHTTRELTRHPFSPEILRRRKVDFIAAIAAFKEGKRVAPGREKNSKTEVLVGPPLPPPTYVGRENLTGDISEVLYSTNGRAAAVGMGGVGKTALALKVADSCRNKFPGGILWAEVATDIGGISEMLRTWIRSLGHDAANMEIEEQVALFSNLLSKKVANDGKVLLLIDGVSEIIVGDLLGMFSYVPPDVSILITTREATLCASLGATQFQIPPLGRAHSRQLLESIARSTLVANDQDAVDTLLSLLGDLPLAVELVARQIAVREGKPKFTIGGLCKRLKEFDPDILSFPGHRGIAMSFALSYDFLNDRAKRTFRALGVFSSSPLHTLSIAAAVAESEDDTETVLDQLVAVSLLNWGAAADEYRLHPLLHKYAEHLFELTDSDERCSVQIHFYKHYCSAASTIAENAADDLDAIDRIFTNLSKAVQLASSHGNYSYVVESVLGLSSKMEFFTSRNLDRESIPLLSASGVAAKQLKDREGEATCMGHLGSAFSRLGMVKEAIALYESAITIVQKIGDDYDLASHLQNLASTLLSEARDLPRAERLLHEALTAAEGSKNIDVVIGSLSTLGSLHRDIGKLKEAAKLYSGALEAARLAGNRLSEGNNLSNLGLVTDQLGQSDEGEQMIREALAIAAEVGDVRGEGNRTGHLGGILFRRATALPPGPEQTSAFEDARKQLASALQFAKETGDEEKAGSWMMNLGSLDFFEGNSAEGIGKYEEALRVAKARGLSRLEAQVHFNFGSALVPIGQLKAALDHFDRSSELLRKMGSPMAPKAEFYASRVEAMLGQCPEV